MGAPRHVVLPQGLGATAIKPGHQDAWHQVGAGGLGGRAVGAAGVGVQGRGVCPSLASCRHIVTSAGFAGHPHGYPCPQRSRHLAAGPLVCTAIAFMYYGRLL
jgi:hypothetical protein